MSDEPPKTVQLQHFVTSEGKLRLQLNHSVQWLDFDQAGARNMADLLQSYAKLNFIVQKQEQKIAPVFNLIAGGKVDEKEPDKCNACGGTGKLGIVDCKACEGKGV